MATDTDINIDTCLKILTDTDTNTGLKTRTDTAYQYSAVYHYLYRFNTPWWTPEHQKCETQFKRLCSTIKEIQKDIFFFDQNQL